MCIEQVRIGEKALLFRLECEQTLSAMFTGRRCAVPGGRLPRGAAWPLVLSGRVNRPEFRLLQRACTRECKAFRKETYATMADLYSR